jgi:hypothetical protein
MKRKIILWIVLGTPTILTITPIVFFILNFKSHIISENISDWGSFGDYFGGIINPIISLLNLIVLGYITYLIAKNSVEENKKLYFLQRRIEAFDELMRYMPQFNMAPSRILLPLKKMEKKIKETNSFESVDSIIEEINMQMNIFSEFHFFIFNYRVRFGHLFNYDFNSEDYKNLLLNTGKFKDYFKSISEKLITQEKHETDEQLIDYFNTASHYLANFLNELRKELN